MTVILLLRDIQMELTENKYEFATHRTSHFMGTLKTTDIRKDNIEYLYLR